ncbi:hepatic and glial cell adhesion molecule-like [Hemitrygon akajei]|uniref:hepatic and glial cell adhesion molecule-like n=1 Tax=Hemitrygon akajei TaxID=2704970 RepID=UPI003BF9D85B
MTVSLWPRGPGSSLGAEGGLCALVFLLLLHNVDAGIQIKTQQHDFFVIEGRNFTIAADIKMAQGDTIASAFWAKKNGERQRIVDCLPDRVETASYSTYTGRGRCTMQADKIALTLTELTPKDSGDYELKITLNSGEIGTMQFTGKLYAPVFNVTIVPHSEKTDRQAKLTLICKVSAGTDPIFNWTASNEPVARSSKYVLSADRSVLTILELESSDCRVYTCIVNNDANVEKKLINVSESDGFAFCREESVSKITTFHVILIVVSLLMPLLIGIFVWLVMRSSGGVI